MSRVIRYSAVIFDMDDTLISRRDAFARLTDNFYDSHLAMHSTPKPEALRLLTEWDARGDNDKREYFARISERWPGQWEPVDELIDQFWLDLASTVQPDHTSLDVLEQLNAARVPWGILTNGQSQMQRSKLVNARLDSIAPFILVPSEFGDQKPSPAVFQAAIAEAGTFPSETLFVGDSPHNDVRGAQSIGMPTAWMRAGRDGWPGGEPPPDHQIDHIREIIPFVIN
jgi:putative hydrolase of the HAD superfamily